MAQPCWALMMAAGNAAARDWTWKNLQPTVAAARPDAADLGEMEPGLHGRVKVLPIAALPLSHL
jgi:hypothetical protein